MDTVQCAMNELVRGGARPVCDLVLSQPKMDAPARGLHGSIAHQMSHVRATVDWQPFRSWGGGGRGAAPELFTSGKAAKVQHVCAEGQLEFTNFNMRTLY